MQISAVLKELIQALEDQPDFLLFQGKENLIFDSLSIGASGFIVSLLHLDPKVFTDLYAAIQLGEIDKAKMLQQKVDELLSIIRQSIEKRPESSTLFHILNYALQQRKVCENILLEQDGESPLWLNQNIKQALAICNDANKIFSHS